MKRFAAHYLLLPEVGFIRQQVLRLLMKDVSAIFSR